VNFGQAIKTGKDKECEASVGFLATSLREQPVIPNPLFIPIASARTIDLAQTLIVHGTSFCVEPQRSCQKRRTTLHGTRP